MRWLVIPLVLVLAGCSSSGDWFRHDEPQPQPEPVANQDTAPRTGADQPAAPRSVPGNMTPAAQAAAADSARPGELLDCVTDSCKVNCSPKVPKQFRPKWCARFKEPN